MQPSGGTAAPPGSPVTLNALALRPAGAGVSTYIRELVRALDDTDVATRVIVQRDATVSLLGKLRVVRDQHERGVLTAVERD